MSEHVDYVAGFMFSRDLSRVALIRKQKPAWQAGKLNGIGGKIETDDKSFEEAMAREFLEETGCATDPQAWREFCGMGGDTEDGTGGFTVHFFVTIGEMESLKSMESEQVEVIDTRSIHPLRPDMIENLPWLISLAIDFYVDGRPSVVEARYGAAKVQA